MSGALRLGAALLLLAGYALAVHHVNLHPGHRSLGAALAVLPLLALALDVARRLRPKALAVATGAAVMAVVVVTWRAAEAHFERLLLGQQALAYLCIAVLFAASLLPGRTPLCTRMAAALQGPLDAATRRYTRQVTAAWAVLLLAIAATMSILYAAGAIRAWSLFANFGPLVLLPAMFLAELQVRRRRLPQAPRTGLLQMLRAWRTRDVAGHR